MNFAEEYLTLLEKFDKEYQDLKLKKITKVFGEDIHEYNLEDIILQYKSDLDYDEDVSPCVSDKNGLDVGYCENWNTTKVRFKELSNIEKAFEKFLEDIYDIDLSFEDNQELFVESVLKYGIESLVANFYLSCFEAIELEASKEYSELKNKFPNQKFYPNFTLETKDFAYYESSKCW